MGRQSPIASVQRTLSTLASHSAIPRGTNVKWVNANRSMRIATQRKQGLWGLVSVFPARPDTNRSKVKDSLPKSGAHHQGHTRTRECFVEGSCKGAFRRCLGCRHSCFGRLRTPFEYLLFSFIGKVDFLTFPCLLRSSLGLCMSFASFSRTLEFRKYRHILLDFHEWGSSRVSHIKASQLHFPHLRIRVFVSALSAFSAFCAPWSPGGPSTFSGFSPYESQIML